MSTGDCDACNLVRLDWTNHQVLTDNFAGAGNNPGPDQPNEIRYGNIGSYQGQSLDLVLTETPGFRTREGYCRNRNDQQVDACLAGGGQNPRYFGGFGVRRGAENQMQVTFTLQYSATRSPAVVPLFCFSFVDIGRGDGPSTREHMRPRTCLEPNLAPVCYMLFRGGHIPATMLFTAPDAHPLQPPWSCRLLDCCRSLILLSDVLSCRAPLRLQSSL